MLVVESEPLVTDAPLRCATVLIATRNRWPQLAVCLESLQAQELPAGLAVRVRVVDNGSTDGSLAALLAYAAASGPLPVEVLQEPRAGKSAALNLGLRGLEHGFVAFTDDDMRLDRRWLAAILSHFTACPCGGVNGRVELELLQPMPPWFTPRCAELLGAVRGRTDGEPVEALQGANMAVRASLLASIGSFREDMGPRGNRYASAEDVEWSRRLIRLGERLCYCDGALGFHRVGTPHVSRRALFWRQFEYARRDVVEGYAVTKRTWAELVGEVRGLLGALLIRRRPFAGFDFGLEIAGRCGRVAGRIDLFLGGTAGRRA